MFWFKKEKPNPPEIKSAAWSGDRADAAQLDFYVTGAKPINRSQFQLLDKEVQGLVKAFYDMALQSTQVRDRNGLVKAWRLAQQHTINRKNTNRLAFMTVPEHEEAVADQGKAFVSHAGGLFGRDSFISVNGEQVISTRKGGGLWYLKQLTLVLLNPIRETREIHTQNGDKSTAIRKTVVTIKPGLFDDFVKLTKAGIVISNPNLGADEFLVPWSQADTLILSSNATMLVDPINSWVRPMFRGLSQTQWVPFGTFTIKDRQSGDMLVTALMGHPDEFKNKLQKLIKRMKHVAVSPERVDPVAPVDLSQFMGALPGAVREEIVDLLEMDGRKNRRRFKYEKGDGHKQIFTFQGNVYADEKSMKKDLEAALKKIVREPDPDIKRARLTALKELTRKIEPFAGDLLGRIVVKIMRAQFK